LKADYDLVKGRVNKFLDGITEKDILDIDYSYTKDPTVNGDYTTKCFLLIIEK
jgi:hypothetical protein